jgi:excisionase family DNA binding protein
VGREPISLNEAAEQLGVHYMTVYRYVRTGRLSASKDGVEWRVDPRDVEQLRRREPAPRRARRSQAERARRLEARLVAADETGAWTAIESALASGTSPADVYIDLLVPALTSIGDRWATGELDVADEHRASAVALRLIGRLGPRFRRRGRHRGTVLLGSTPGEQHAIPTAIVADLLRGEGYDAIDLGADTPSRSFVHGARAAERLRLIALAVTVRGTERAATQVIRALRRADIDVPVAVGGAAIETERLALDLGADVYSGRDGRTAARVLAAAAAGELPERSRRSSASQPGR